MKTRGYGISKNERRVRKEGKQGNIISRVEREWKQKGNRISKYNMRKWRETDGKKVTAVKQMWRKTRERDGKEKRNRKEQTK